jgi:large subunit ribosomal protein L4
MEVKVYNLEGNEVEKLKVSEDVFGLSSNDDLVHQAVLAIMGNQRQVLADTKTRGERAGSGKKPWKQKGTGRARVGSVRTPVWRKGGVVFGPNTERNFKLKINKKMNARAICLVLSGKMRDKEIVVLDEIKFSENKTKRVAVAFSKLNVKGSMLVAFSAKEKEFRLSTRNMKKVENIMTEQLNVLDMLNSKNLILSKESISLLEKKYGREK